MKIEEIDKNFLISGDIAEEDIVWWDIRQAPFVIYGIDYDENYGCYTRMPQKLAEQISEGVAYLNFDTAGGRVRFRTDSDFIGIHAIMNNKVPMPHMTLIGQSGFDLYRKEKGGGTEKYYCSFIPSVGMQTGYSASVSTDGTFADYTINFPLYDGVKEVYIALKKNAVILEPTPYRYPVPVVYYGSSITQGGCASRPGNSYQAIISRRLDMNYINMGFSGSGKAEDLMVRYLANLEMSAFVCDYDHNAPDVEYLKKSHLPLYRAVREKQSNLPIIFISAPSILMRPEKFIARREVIRETYKIALDERDDNVYFIDGAELFGGDDWDLCTVDGCHPNDLGFYRMAMRIEKEIIQLL